MCTERDRGRERDFDNCRNHNKVVLSFVMEGGYLNGKLRCCCKVRILVRIHEHHPMHPTGSSLLHLSFLFESEFVFTTTNRDQVSVTHPPEIHHEFGAFEKIADCWLGMRERDKPRLVGKLDCSS